MESVMDFLADYYIWFFVAAGILCFALIGFIIETKKKEKNEFKGETIEENNGSVNTTPNTETSEPKLESVNTTLDETMEINDIPVSEPAPAPVSEPITNLESNETPVEETKPSIEFFSEPVSMPNVEPASEMEVLEETPLNNNVSYETSESVMNNLSNEEVNTEEKPVELNIFDDLN